MDNMGTMRNKVNKINLSPEFKSAAFNHSFDRSGFAQQPNLVDGTEKYMQFISQRADLVSSDQERELAKRIRNGDESARRKLVQANLRLVISLAKKYAGKGPEFLELVQAGNLGLMKAVDMFDYRKGFRFSTYASWWIKHYIFQAYTDHDRQIRLPAHVFDSMTKLRRARDQFKKTEGRSPTETELATALGITLKKLQRLRRVTLNTVSLESEMVHKDGNSQPLSEVVEDHEESIDEQLFKEGALDSLRQAIKSVLSPREQDVLAMRFGFKHIGKPETGTKGKMTLEEIGKRYDVTRECIRQIELRAIRKLRNSVQLKQIVD
ncbi:MAG: sigma-70 family RNA polymerase sigma factor [Vampirovibrio sp.]|nr:sigma-70 family RNA polymerase sigma factor [Vampirovibrio sp.]